MDRTGKGDTPRLTTFSKRPQRNILNKSFCCVLTSVLAITFSSTILAGPREQAKRISDLLTGVPPSTQLIDDMAAAIGGAPAPPIANLIAAADLALLDPASKKAFYNVTVKNFATPWTNEAQTVFAPLNDYSATVIGMVLNGDDFREVLSGDYLYTGGTSVTTPNEPDNNNHFAALENQNIDLSTALTKVPQSIPAPAGVMTSRAAARAFFVDGTNRAMLRFTLLNHLCYDLEQLKDSTRPADRVRQDVSRSPGGDSRLFLNNCLACHAGMDPLAQAFAHYQWQYTEDNVDAGQLVYNPASVQPKYLINSTNFKGGYVTETEDWTNYWRRGGNVWLGWANNGSPQVVSGTGAQSLGVELASSDAFARCQVKKVFKAVCMRNPQNAPGRNDATAFDSMVANFTNDSYRMKGVFTEAAAYCSGPSTP